VAETCLSHYCLLSLVPLLSQNFCICPQSTNVPSLSPHTHPPLAFAYFSHYQHVCIHMLQFGYFPSITPSVQIDHRQIYGFWCFHFQDRTTLSYKFCQPVTIYGSSTKTVLSCSISPNIKITLPVPVWGANCFLPLLCYQQFNRFIASRLLSHACWCGFSTTTPAATPHREECTEARGGWWP